MISRTLGVLIVSALAMVHVAGCFKHPTIDPAKLTCKGPENCPKGTTCSVENRCVPVGTALMDAGGATDASRAEAGPIDVLAGIDGGAVDLPGLLDGALADGPNTPSSDGAIDRSPSVPEVPAASLDSSPVDVGSMHIPVGNDGSLSDSALIKPIDGPADRFSTGPEVPVVLPDSGPVDMPVSSNDGGPPGTGGIVATGGIPSTGGVASTGGVIATGGVTSTGGVLSTGGVIATGGVSSNPLGLHAASVTDLGNNLYRVTYDFQTAEQLSDWLIADARTTTVALNGGRLRVNAIGAGSAVSLARFVLPARITSLTVKSNALNTVTGGPGHTNIYLSTVWNGNDWTATAGGYGCIITANQGRMFVDGGNTPPTTGPFTTPTLLMNQTYEHVVTMNDTTLSWGLSLCSGSGCGITPSAASTYLPAGGTYPGINRHLFLGAWETTVEFDDLTIVGYFGSN